MKTRFTLLAVLLVFTLAASSVAQERVRRTPMPTSGASTSAVIATADTSASEVVFEKVVSYPTITLKIDGNDCKGAVGDGEFYINRWQFAAALPVSIGVSGGAQAGKASISTITITKNFDACSSSLLRKLLSAKVFEKATIKVKRDGKEELNIFLEDLFIVGFSVASSVSDQNAPETVEISFAKIRIENPQDGKADLIYNVILNKVE